MLLCSAVMKRGFNIRMPVAQMNWMTSVIEKVSWVQPPYHILENHSHDPRKQENLYDK